MTYETEAATKVCCNGTPGGEPCDAVETWGVYFNQVQANRVAAQKGWHVRPSKRHICPSCWAKGER